MKRFFRRLQFVIIAMFAVSFASCDGGEYPSEGYFNVGETSYSINEAKLFDVGYDSESEMYQLRLTMRNTSHNDTRSINILFYTEINNYLPSGIYTPYLYDNHFKNRFKRGAWLIGNEECGVFLTGRVHVTKTNDIYKIDINCKDVNGVEIVGEYDGEIQVLK